METWEEASPFLLRLPASLITRRQTQTRGYYLFLSSMQGPPQQTNIWERLISGPSRADRAGGAVEEGGPRFPFTSTGNLPNGCRRTSRRRVKEESRQRGVPPPTATRTAAPTTTLLRVKQLILYPMLRKSTAKVE